MDLKRPLVVLALVGALAGCGSSTDTGGNTDLERGTTECGAAEAGASEQQELCEDAETDNEEQSETEDDGSG